MARYYGSTAIAAVLAGTIGAAGVAKADRVTYELVVSFTDFGGTEYTADLSFTYELGLTGSRAVSMAIRPSAAMWTNSAFR